MIYDQQPLDLSAYGGRPDAQVIDLVLQELDQDNNVVFQWNGRDHFAITDTYEPLTTPLVDLVHGNAVELDADGNLLLSSRHLSEITKINRTTGDIVWRLGGKHNQFTFNGDPVLPDVGAFSYQHDIRRQANGNITLFDNGNQFISAGQRGSRGVEYSLDEAAKTATLVREFRLTPDVVSIYMGNLQRLPNGNSLVGWGGGTLGPSPAQPAEAATEFTASGQVAMSVNFAGTPYTSYRAYRFPWHGYPTTPPTLVAVTNTLPISLYYSWNGATDVVSYTVSGGTLAETMTDFAVQSKTGFEEQTGCGERSTRSLLLPSDPVRQLGPEEPEHRISLTSAMTLVPTGFTASPAEAGSRALVLPGATRAGNGDIVDRRRGRDHDNSIRPLARHPTWPRSASGQGLGRCRLYCGRL